MAGRRYAVSPFLKTGDAFFRETRDEPHVVALDIYPQLLVRTLNFLRCSPSTESMNNAILNWDAAELEAAAAEGLGSGEGADERRISSRTAIHGGPLENASDHGGEDWGERSGSAQGE
jgi:hypothetical protein